LRVVAIVDPPVSPGRSVLADSRGGSIPVTDATGSCTLCRDNVLPATGHIIWDSKYRIALGGEIPYDAQIVTDRAMGRIELGNREGALVPADGYRVKPVTANNAKSAAL
jgi:hypothetical protein